MVSTLHFFHHAPMMMMLYEKFSHAECRVFIREGESQINVYFWVLARA
jgi:hypothetical protein